MNDYLDLITMRKEELEVRARAISMELESLATEIEMLYDRLFGLEIGDIGSLGQEDAIVKSDAGDIQVLARKKHNQGDISG